MCFMFNYRLMMVAFVGLLWKGEQSNVRIETAGVQNVHWTKQKREEGLCEFEEREHRTQNTERERETEREHMTSAAQCWFCSSASSASLIITHHPTHTKKKREKEEKKYVRVNMTVSCSRRVRGDSGERERVGVESNRETDENKDNGRAEEHLQNSTKEKKNIYINKADNEIEWENHNYNSMEVQIIYFNS